MKLASLAAACCIPLGLVTACSSASTSGASAGGDGGSGGGSSGGSSSGSSGASSSGGGTASSGGSSGGAGCGSGSVVTLATGQANVGGIAANGTYVAFTTTDMPESNLLGPGNIMAVLAAGGTPVALATNVDQSALLTMDGTNVYWAGPDSGYGIIYKAPIMGGDGGANSLVNNLVDSPIDVAADSTNVYWVGDTTIQKVPIAGGAKTILAKGQNLAGVFQQPCVAVNASGVYASTANAILSVPLAGGTPTTIASNQSPNAITADAANVYWTNLGHGGGVATTVVPAVMKVAATGGTPVTLVALGATAIPAFIAVDSTNVYWIEATGCVRKVPIAGGSPVALAAAPFLPGGIAVDATSVYWTDTEGGKVYKTAK